MKHHDNLGEPPTDHHRATIHLFAKPDCPCSARARDLLFSAQQRYPLDLEVTLVPELMRDGRAVALPRVEIDGRLRFQRVVNPVLLERWLRHTFPESAHVS